jgi:hypothetical protein
VVLFPLMNLRSVTFFTKLNALGVVSVVYVDSRIANAVFPWCFS